jgi:hypothetical protein
MRFTIWQLGIVLTAFAVGCALTLSLDFPELFAALMLVSGVMMALQREWFFALVCFATVAPMLTALVISLAAYS